MNSTNLFTESRKNSTEEWNFPEVIRAWAIIQAVALCCLAAFGLFSNAFVMAAVLVSRRLRSKVVYVLSCHLGASGVMWSSVCIPVGVVLVLENEWPWSQSSCNLFAVVHNLCVQLSVWTIVLLSWEKYRAIVLPLRHPTTARSLRAIPSVWIGGAWILSLATDLFPILFAGGFSYDGAIGFFAARNADDLLASIHSGVFLSLTFFLPLLVLLFCYVRIFAVARHQNKRIVVMAAMVRVITLSVGVPLTKDQARRSTRHATARNGRASQTICKFLGAFVACFIPFAISNLLDRSRPSGAIRSLAGFLLSTSPSINAVVYGIENKALRSSFRHYLGKKFPRKTSSFFGGKFRSRACESNAL